MANNLDKQDNLNLTLSFPVPIRKWWTIQNNVTVLYNQYNTVYLDEVYNVDVVSWNAYMANNFVLGKGLTANWRAGTTRRACTASSAASRWAASAWACRNRCSTRRAT
jgi:hypothetical protein